MHYGDMLSRIMDIYTTNLPTTDITPTKIAWLELPVRSPMGLGIPPLWIKIMLESNPLKSKMLVGRLGVLICYTI